MFALMAGALDDAGEPFDDAYLGRLLRHADFWALAAEIDDEMSVG